jgi:hypothetical protein
VRSAERRELQWTNRTNLLISSTFDPLLRWQLSVEHESVELGMFPLNRIREGRFGGYIGRCVYVAPMPKISSAVCS